MSASPALRPSSSLQVPFTPALPAATHTPLSPAQIPGGRSIVVSSSADSGPGTLRQALQDAQKGDTIIFDPAVFPPDAPETIAVTSGLPQISQSYLTIDASDAGVILDGSQLPPDSWIPGLEIVSDGNTIRGLQVIHFTGTGIVVALHGQNNTVGGNRGIGSGPTGQGNLTSGNDFGIGLWDSASHNTVTGNLVGTDASGAAGTGNRSAGIWIVEGGRQNIVGPDNIIAGSGRCGIQIEGSDSFGNTLTQNSVHDNVEAGVCLLDGANAMIAAPLVFDIDLDDGLVSGAACANCIVEVYSDASGEGGSYEGQAICDSSGAFTFSKGVPFTGPNLTAWATDPNGNTSEFSTPPLGVDRTLSLQQGNSLPKIPLLPKPSAELLDNHIGVHFEDFGRYSNTELVYQTGFKWVRIHSLTEFWNDTDQPGADALKTFTLESIPPQVDAIIDDYAANGVNVVLDLWMGAGLRPYGTTFRSEVQVERFSDYVRFMVSHFKDRIPYYEIWNEPGDIAVRDYADLVRHVVPIIRELDPRARVIIGAVPGNWANGYPGYGIYQRFSVDTGYLDALLLSGVAPLVDGVSWHPFYDNIPSDPYYQNYPQIMQGIQELAAAQGFTGEYFADEVLWRTVTEQGEDGGPPVSKRIASKYYARAISIHRGLGANVTINIFFLEPHLSTIHNLCNTLAGAQPVDMAVSVDSETADRRPYGISLYTFSLPAGERLVALWTNGAAVEDDPGVSATVTIPAMSAQKVTGIDVFYGFEQELITEIEKGNLVIRDLLVKDYPIILRISDIASP